MRPLIKTGILAAVCAAWLGTAAPARAQEESPAAKATRKRLKQKITIDWKDTRIKEAADDLKRELDGRLGIKIDNESGISNNFKVTLTAKDQPVEKILNDLCDRYELGYYVVSNPKDRYDGWVVLRKSKYKERGYKEGKEPKSGASLRPEKPRAENRESRIEGRKERPFVSVLQLPTLPGERG